MRIFWGEGKEQIESRKRLAPLESKLRVGEKHGTCPTTGKRPSRGERKKGQWSATTLRSVFALYAGVGSVTRVGNLTIGEDA